MKSSEIINELEEIISSNETSKDLKIYKGQRKDNILYLKESRSKSGFEFGDLRVEFKNSRIIMEIDTAGGVTNLMKYFYILDNPDKFKSSQIVISKPTRMLHIFVRKNANDYKAHEILWEYLYKSYNSKAGSFKANFMSWDGSDDAKGKVETELCKMLNEAANQN
jgi:hypothetical protein